MPNSKQINELTQASSVNSTDQLPLAQQGGSEAVRATVSQIAQAVGELNETGALSELTLATSLGKNLLAQNLTEKGIPTSPSETLISMANKVGSIQVDDSRDLLIGGMAIGETFSNYTTDSGYGNANSTCLLNGYTALVSHNKLYFCDTYGDYTGMEDFVNNSYSNVSLPYSGTNSLLSVSPNGNYLTVMSVDSSSTIYIYSIDYTTKTFTLYKTVSLQSAYTSWSTSCCNNDASLIAYITPVASNKNYIIIASTDDTTISTTVSSTDVSWYSDYYPRICFDNELNYLYYFNGTAQGNNRAYYWRISYTATSSSITATIMSRNGIYSNNHGQLNLCPFSSLILYKDNNEQQTTYKNYTSNIRAIDLKTNTYSNVVPVNMNINWIITSSSGSLNYMIVPIGFCNCPVVIEGDLVKYHVALPEGYFIYNFTTGTLSFERGTDAAVPYITNLCFNSTISANSNYFTATNFFDIKKRYVFTHPPTGVQQINRIEYKPNQVYGISRTHNEITTNYTNDVFSIESIKSGNYDATTVKVELQEESDESN